MEHMSSIDPKTHLDPTLNFDTFISSDSNRFTCTVALATAEGRMRDYGNPLYIFGDSGVGKTHLLNAIGNYALIKDPDLRVLYVEANDFNDEFRDALQDPEEVKEHLAEFNRKYSEIDMLLIDDIQLLSGKNATLEQLLHTFNALKKQNKIIVVTSDAVAKDLKNFDVRLISLFESGLNVDVKTTD